jgi:SAM-dependent methyltransferase
MITRDNVISKAEVLTTYNKLYESQGRLRDSDALYRWTLKLLKVKSGKSLLDVACGEGVLIRLAQESGLKSIGIDIAIQAARIAQQQTSDNIVAVGEGETLPFENGSFDYVTNLGSLEHFFDPKKGVREMHRVLKPGGRAVILLPNSYYLADIVWHVWRTGYSVNHNQPIERFATYGEWKDLLEQGGLNVRSRYKYNFRFPRTRNDWHWYFRHSRKFLYLAVSPFIPFNLSYSFLYICTRR